MLIENTVNGDNDDEYSGFLLGLAASRAILGGSRITEGITPAYLPTCIH